MCPDTPNLKFPEAAPELLRTPAADATQHFNMASWYSTPAGWQFNALEHHHDNTPNTDGISQA
jgi:hypothetical protein